MSWYLKTMEDMLSEDDKQMLQHIYEPKVVVVPAHDTYTYSSVLPDGEIRLYGGDIGRGKHEDNGSYGYLFSRDCGLSWHQHMSSPSGRDGCGVRSPISGRYIGITENEILKFDNGPDAWPRNIKITDQPYGCLKLPVFLQGKPGRCIVTCHKDVEYDEGNFIPVVLISDDDAETFRAIELPSDLSTEPFYPDKGYRWRNRGSEPAVCELPDGTLHLITRTSDNYFHEYYSYDHGDSWEGTGTPVNGIHGSLTTPLFLRLSDQRVIMFWNNTHVMPEPNHHALWPKCHWGHFVGELEDMFTNRDAAHAAVTSDGKTFLGQREILLSCIRNDADYRRAGGRYNIADKSLQQFEAWELPYHKIFVVMGQSIASRRGVIFDVDWLLEKNREEDFSKGLEHVSTQMYLNSIRGSWFGHNAVNRVPGAIMVPNPDGESRDVVQIARYHDENLATERAGLVWNFPMSKKGEVTIEVLIRGAGLRVTLSDHWHSPSDVQVQNNAPVSFCLEKSDLLHDGWNTVRIFFDTEQGLAVVKDELDEEMFCILYRKILILGGISYLHLQTLAEEQDTMGSYIRYLKKEEKQ